MKLQQIRYVIEVAKTGSISKAAKNLFLSQPNISNSIKSLENELGITIFLRTNNGIILTNEGNEFLKYAKSIKQGYDNILKIKSNDDICKFTLSSSTYSVVMEAFSMLCKKHENKSNIQLTIKTHNYLECIDSIYKNQSDLGIVLLTPFLKNYVVDTLKNKNITLTPLKKLSININVRKGHPLIIHDNEIDFNKLKEYPFVNYYSEEQNEFSFLPEVLFMNIVNKNKIISVNDRETRCNIVSTTNAFSIGCTLHPQVQNFFNWISIPIPNIYVELCYMKLKSRELSKEALMFLEILNHELINIT